MPWPVQAPMVYLPALCPVDASCAPRLCPADRVKGASCGVLGAIISVCGYFLLKWKIKKPAGKRVSVWLLKVFYLINIFCDRKDLGCWGMCLLDCWNSALSLPCLDCNALDSYNYQFESCLVVCVHKN